MKNLLKVAAVCLGLFIATPSFSQVGVNLQFGHRYHRVPGGYIYSEPGYHRHVWTNGGVIYRHEYGAPAVRVYRHRFFRDENGNTYRLDGNGDRMYNDENGNVYRLDENGNRVYIP